MKYNEYIKKAIKKQDEWILKVWNSFDEFNDDVKSGDILTIPVNCIVPRSEIEFENATGESYTNSMIEMTKETINRTGNNNAEIVIYDGHNRLKNLIKNGIKEVTVRIK